MIINENSNITFTGSEADKSHFFGKDGELPSLSDDITASLDLITLPVELKLYVARQCPHCPHVVRTITPLALTNKNIRLKIIDGTIAADEAAKDNIMSVPCLILDNGFRWTGAVSARDVVDMIINRDISGLSTESLKMILEEGKAGWIAEQIVEHGKMFEGFIGLITHETWSVRLGAMVVLEEIEEKSPEIALTIAPELLSRFKNADVPTQGDILYALGVVGDSSVKDEIIRLMDITDPQKIHADVLEAAQEAIESIESRL